MSATSTNDIEIASSDNSEPAHEIINNATKWSAAAAVVPVPYLDLIALGAVQLNMVRDLGKLYGQYTTDKVIKSAIGALLGTLGPAVVSAGILGSSLKLIPVSGTLLGSAGMAAGGSAATYAIGKVFLSHFEKGGSIDDLDADAKANEMKEAVEIAKKK
jgi:uncharacterized protein (DUF697 family)